MIYASKLAGTLEADATEGGVLKGIGLDIGNGNFVVDANGNATILGGLSLYTGAISWSNLDATTRGTINDKITAADAQTYIDSTLVSSPTIVGGRYWDANRTASLILNDPNTTTYAMLYGRGAVTTATDSNCIFGVYNDAIGTSIDLYMGGKQFLRGSTSASVNQVVTQGAWYIDTLCVNYGTSDPGTSTPGYGINGAVYFKIS